MNPVTLKIDVTGLAEATGELQLIRKGLADRTQLHAALAVDMVTFTRDFLTADSRHATAQRLGAQPTGFRARSAKYLEADSDAEAAIMRIPRSTGLGRAFGDVVIVPGAGRTYLTIPGCAETYGKVLRDFPAGAFKFAIFHGHRPFPALVWAEDGGTHRKGDVAWWLRRSVTQKQDRSLLPSDAAYLEIARQRSVLYIASLRYRAA